MLELVSSTHTEGHRHPPWKKGDINSGLCFPLSYRNRSVAGAVRSLTAALWLVCIFRAEGKPRLQHLHFWDFFLDITAHAEHFQRPSRCADREESCFLLATPWLSIYSSIKMWRVSQNCFCIRPPPRTAARALRTLHVWPCIAFSPPLPLVCIRLTGGGGWGILRGQLSILTADRLAAAQSVREKFQHCSTRDKLSSCQLMKIQRALYQYSDTNDRLFVLKNKREAAVPIFFVAHSLLPQQNLAHVWCHKSPTSKDEESWGDLTKLLFFHICSVSLKSAEHWFWTAKCFTKTSALSAHQFLCQIWKNMWTQCSTVNLVTASPRCSSVDQPCMTGSDVLFRVYIKYMSTAPDKDVKEKPNLKI